MPQAILDITANEQLTTALAKIQANFSALFSYAVGNVWVVNAATGNDNGPGTPAAPFATLDAAQTYAKSNNGDVVLVQGSSLRSTTLTWALSGVALVGLNAPSNNGRSRIAVASGLTQAQVTALGTLVSVTGEGNAFINMGTFHGFDDSLNMPATATCWSDIGGRNHYSKMQFLGGGNPKLAALAAMRSLVLGGDGEDLIEDCTIGLDTILRATNPNASLEITSGAPRIRIKRSLFQSWVSDASDVHILIASGGMDRYLSLEKCHLHNFTGGGGLAMDVAISNAGGSPGGDVMFSPDSMSVGATKIGTAGVYVGQISATGGGTTGLGVLAS